MKRLSITAISLLFVLFFANAAISAIYYISPSGSDSGSGSVTQPFATIGKAATLVNPGDTVIAAPGIYYENYNPAQGQVGVYVKRGGTSAAPVVFQSASPGGAIIDGNNAVQIGVYVQAPYVQIQGFRVRNFTFQGVMIYGSYATVQGNIVNSNGANTTVQTAYGHDGIYTDKSVTNCMISDNIIYANGRLSLAKTAPGGNQDHGIYLCSPNSIVQNNFISGNQAWGIHIAGYVPLGSTLVQGNTIVGNGQSGIIIWQAGAKGCVIQDNTLRGNAAYGLDFLNDGMGHIVRGNSFFQNISGGINPAMATHYTGSNNLVAP
jgi:hypothetical protein